MSIITDALKKAQKERLPAPSFGEQSTGSGHPGTASRKPKIAINPLSGPIAYAIIAAALSMVIIAVYIAFLFYSARPEAAAGNGRKTKSLAAQKTSPIKSSPAPAVKIEPFSFTIPRIASQPTPSVKASPDLTGIMYLPTSPQAVINGRTVKEGDIVDGYTVMKIYPESVMLTADGVETELKLR